MRCGWILFCRASLCGSEGLYAPPPKKNGQIKTKMFKFLGSVYACCAPHCKFFLCFLFYARQMHSARYLQTAPSLRPTDRPSVTCMY